MKTALGFTLAVALLFGISAVAGRGGNRGPTGTGLPSSGGTLTGDLTMSGGDINLNGNKLCVHSGGNACMKTSGGADALGFFYGASRKIAITTNGTILDYRMDTGSDYIYSSSGPMELGGNCTDGATGEVCTANEVYFGAGAVMAHVVADPCPGGFPEGSLFYNATGNFLCYCSAADADLKVADNAACF